LHIISFMCGIFFTLNAGLKEERLQALNAMMHHRGPDASGHFYKPPFFLAHNRLSILDPDVRSNQPFFSRSRKHVITYNGEIYNYPELVKKYNLQLRTTCDTELLIELYERYGENILSELNGMFAFVILNLENNSVFAARDRLGIKPLYVYEQGKVLALSSEIAPLLELSGTNAIDDVGLRQYRKLRTFFGGHTLYKDIRFFPAGNYYKDGNYVQYWELPKGEKTPPSDEELHALVQSAVKSHCLSDVPLGTFLSGGLDSSIVTMLAKPTSTWSVGFSSDNEFKWADLVARESGSEHYNITVDDEQFLSTAGEMIRKRKEPLSVPNEVLIYLMSKEANCKNKVLISGEGADELFFGYDRIFKWAADQDQFDITQFDQLYSYSKKDDLEIVEDVLAPFRKNNSTPIDIVSSFFQIAHLHGLLRRLDNSTMLASIEGRVPFVDHRLVEIMAGLSYSYKTAGGVIKAPLKRVFSKLLPPSIIARAKVGFPVPLARLMKSPDPNKAYDSWIDFNLKILDISAS